MNPRYNHDKIRGEFRQSYLKLVSSIFHVEDTFLFSGIVFSTQKSPCPSHFCERQRPFAARFQFGLEKLFSLFAYPTSCVATIRQRFTKNKNTLPLTETRKRKGVELIILLSYQSQHVRTSKAGTSCHSARHLKHF